MLIHGGTIRNGRLITVSVIGAYWISSIRSLRNTTSPGVTATSTPKVKALTSVWRTRNSPLPASMSSCSIFMPRTRLAPFSSKVCRISSGLVITKFEGERAPVSWRR
ncbi:hypothetical protein MPOCJGCO_3325 [Methylobacterium trifolii]|uniref:Uncharacterized protein n=1 Tax=Methylobacterium trifolii TaxID=1003092 RepID=A0ABQ4U2Y2_9HYPH|nr:hypothetical protein MPOCJGCO_3325 [Methylobacterium trifolii]